MNLICRITGTHDLLMETYPPGDVFSVCTRCGHVDIKPAPEPVPQPVHEAQGGQGSWYCALCGAWQDPPADYDGDHLLDHLREIHGVTATTDPSAA